MRRLAVELDVGPHDAVALGIGAVGGRMLEDGHILGNDGQHGNPQRSLDILHGLDAGIEVFDQEGQTDAQGQSHGHGQNHVQGNIGLGGKIGNLGFFPDRGGPLRHGALHRLGGIAGLGRLQDLLRLEVLIFGRHVAECARLGILLSGPGIVEIALHGRE